MLLLCSFTLSSFTNRAITIGEITDSTSITSDLTTLNINQSGLVKLTGTEYDIDRIIAIGENKTSGENVDVYLYVYNPISHNSPDEYYFDMTINEAEVNLIYSNNNDTLEEYKGASKLIYLSNYNNIVFKFKFSYKNYYNERNYLVTKIKNITDDKEYESNFDASFVERESSDSIETSFNYDSTFYVEDSKLLGIKAKDFKTVLGSTTLGFFFDSFVEYFKYLFRIEDEAWFTIWMYNFDSNIDIDRIISVKVSYEKEEFFREAWGIGNKFHSKYPDGHTYVSSVIKTINPGTTTLNIYGKEDVTLEAFRSPASLRLDEFEGVFESLDSSLFDYEHSVLVDVTPDLTNVMMGYYYYWDLEAQMTGKDSVTSPGVLKVSDNLPAGVGKPFGGTYEESHFDTSTTLTNLKLLECEYECDGVVHNAYVVDKPHQPEIITPEPEHDWLMDLIMWIKDHPLQFVLILVGLIVGIPLVVAILPYILSILGKLLAGIFKCIVWIITLPFRLIEKLINKIKERKRKKEDYKYLM